MTKSNKQKIAFQPYRAEWDRKRGTRKKKSFGVFAYWILALLILVALALYALSRIGTM